MTPSSGATRLSACVLALSSFLLLPLHANAQEAPVVPDASAQALPDADDESSEATSSILSPIVEWPAKRLFCVQYARLRSGLAIFGDAKLWWSRAKDVYERFAQPAVDAVMVFSGSKRIRHGHVAVVTQIVSPREVVIDHANWQNQGEIDRNMPVLDVSAKNDWSKVRVWDVNHNQWGVRVYKISGFIAGSKSEPVPAGS